MLEPLLICQSAVSFSHVERLSEHSSVTNSSRGFEGKHGVVADEKDKVGLISVVKCIFKLSMLSVIDNITDYNWGGGGGGGQSTRGHLLDM